MTHDSKTDAGETDEAIARRLAIIMHGDDVEWRGFISKAHHWMSLAIDAAALRAPAHSSDAGSEGVREAAVRAVQLSLARSDLEPTSETTLALYRKDAEHAADAVLATIAPPAPVGAQEALAPFAKLADAADHFGKDDDAKACLFVFPGHGEIDVGVTFGDCRKARAILATLSQPRATDGAVRAAVIEECAKVAESQAQEFLSPGYAAEQPMGSFCERFACEEVAKAIRALSQPSADGGPAA